MKTEQILVLTFLFWMAVCVIGIMIGWIMNVAALVATLNDPISLMEVFRMVGVLFVPLGGVLGYF